MRSLFTMNATGEIAAMQPTSREILNKKILKLPRYGKPSIEKKVSHASQTRARGRGFSENFFSSYKKPHPVNTDRVVEKITRRD